MRVTAKVDYAVRALLEVAAGEGVVVKAEAIAGAQGIPPKFLGSILTDLRRAGLVTAQRGAEGGFRLARPATAITVADIIRAVEGPLANVRGEPPEALQYPGKAVALSRLWVCVRAGLRRVLEHVTVADLVAGELDPDVDRLADDPGAWRVR